jgi:hypothetical protein
MGAARTSGLFHDAPTATSKMAKLDKTSWKSAQGTNDFCLDQARLALLVQKYLLYLYKSTNTGRSKCEERLLRCIVYELF